MIKGGVALELRLPGTARATKDLDIVVNPPGVDLTQELDAALVDPFGGFSFRRKAAVHDLGGGMLRVEDHRRWTSCRPSRSSRSVSQGQISSPASLYGTISYLGKACDGARRGIGNTDRPLRRSDPARLEIH